VSTPDCPHRGDAAAWVLHALADDEAQAYARHLATCPICRDEVDDLQWAVDSLPTVVPPADPPPELRDRIMTIVESEAELLRATGVAADRPAPEPRRRRWGGFLRPLPLATAACVLLLAGLGIGLLVGGSGEGGVRTVAAQVQAPGAQGRLLVADGRAQLLVDGMPSPGAGRVYQVWLLRKGQTKPVSAGALFEVDAAGQGAAAVPGDVSDVSAVMVSSEPAGGSPQPTRQPVLQARLS
jgi:anti-sigma-K factor RskA